MLRQIASGMTVFQSNLIQFRLVLLVIVLYIVAVCAIGLCIHLNLLFM